MAMAMAMVADLLLFYLKGIWILLVLNTASLWGTSGLWLLSESLDVNVDVDVEYMNFSTDIEHRSQCIRHCEPGLLKGRSSLDRLSSLKAMLSCASSHPTHIYHINACWGHRFWPFLSDRFRMWFPVEQFSPIFFLPIEKRKKKCILGIRVAHA